MDEQTVEQIIAVQRALAQQQAAASRDVAEQLVAFRKELVDGGFTTDQAFEMTDAFFAFLMEQSARGPQCFDIEES